ncbi:MAG: HAMP domain-containing sensor histidine kinase [Acidimicrobiia bacterium]
MATRTSESVLGASSDLSQLHRRVVRVGAASAWFAASLLLVAGVLSDNQDLFVEAIAPALAAGLMTAQIVLKTESGGVALFGSAIVVMVMHIVVGNPNTLLPAALALVVICAIAILLIDSHHMQTISVLAVMLVLAPQLWEVSFTEALILGVVMSLSFVMTSIIFLSIRSAATTLNARFQTLFEDSPTAVMEEDWSEALAYLRSEYTGRPDRIRPFLMAYPAVVRRAVNRSRILRVNQAAVDLLEAESATDIQGNRDGSKLTDENIGAFANALAALYEGMTTFEQDVPVMTLKGRRIWLQARGVDTSTGDPATTILVGLADVTHIKARQEAMAELVRAKDEFIAKVSHELRTPLTAVLGLATEMTAMEPMGDEERSELLQLVAGQAQEMSYIVEDLLVASRTEMGTVSIDSRVVDLEVELQSVIDGLGLDIAEIPETIQEAMADPGRVRQVLRNLLTNATRYGGPRIRVMAGALFDAVWLEVRDNGDGVPRELVSRIFEPYGTAHTGVNGSVGLGLSVSRQLAELMKGSLTYRRDGTESVFRLELPLVVKSSQALPLHRSQPVS